MTPEEYAEYQQINRWGRVWACFVYIMGGIAMYFQIREVF